MKLAQRNIFRLLLIFLIFLFALAAIAQHWWTIRKSYHTHITDPGRIEDYLSSHRIRKLQIGAGGNDPTGWLNTDIEPTADEVYLDATYRYPFQDGTFDYVYSEHMIEHVPWEGGVSMLKECYRVLAEGGKIRIVTPDLAKFVRLLTDDGNPETQAYIVAKRRFHGWADTPINGAYIFNHEVRDWGHQFLYNAATLRKGLEIAGFKNIRQYPIWEATDSVFREAEIRTRNPGSTIWIVNNWESMAFEAIR